MTLDRTSAEQAQILERLEDDPRPAWLWPSEGEKPVWTNRAAGLFGARIKHGELKTLEPAVPVKGQIARILRLGLIGQSTLSRMHFMAGRKPLSATTRCTTMRLEDENLYLLVVGVDPIDTDIIAVAPAREPAVQEADSAQEGEENRDEAPTFEGLSALVDKLAQHDHLFDPLDAEDDAPLPVPGRDYATIAYDEEVEASNEAGQSDWGNEDPVAQEEAAFAADGHNDRAPERAGLWQVTGRGLTIPKAEYTEPQDIADTPPEAPEEEADASADAVERTSRYNFEELSRILTDRVGRDEQAEAEPAPLPRTPSPRGALVPLSEEALVLNRLPIGILIFRDQDILFANRALVDLTGYENATTLRNLGLAAVFPTVDAGEPAGPVNHLVRRDGIKVAVSARLNAVTWQGKPSFMLSARANEIEPLREAEVGQFAQLWAKVAGFDFVTADRAGIVSSFVKGTGDRAAISEGAPLSALVTQSEQSALRHFLSLPARYAGGVRPAIALKGTRAGQTLTLFAEGRAGIVSGYFGLLGGGGTAAASGKGALPVAALGRITRGLRRPLNTIAGFSELIASESFGPLANPRYLEYARDIRSASGEIGDLADELDDYVRLAEGEMAVSPADVDIGTLLAESLVRVRGQASKERVLLRSAISERLPMARVDAATLKQAVLNMLASAISEAGEGSRVVMSGQVEDDGSVSIHVRDGAKAPGALAERFVVFRDGVAADGTQRKPSQSSIGLTLTRSLVAVNACSLSLDPASESGTLMTLTIPASLVVR